MSPWGKALLISLGACAVLIPAGVILMLVLTSGVALLLG